MRLLARAIFLHVNAAIQVSASVFAMASKKTRLTVSRDQEISAFPHMIRAFGESMASWYVHIRVAHSFVKRFVKAPWFVHLAS